MDDSKVIYLDNNATTYRNDEYIQAYTEWIKYPVNLSTDNMFSDRAKTILREFNSYMADRLCIDREDITIIYNSGASEGNSSIIDMIVNAHYATNITVPHIVISAMEHSSISLKCKMLHESKLISLSYIVPDIHGYIHPDSVQESIKSSTILVCIQGANNEIGTIQPYREIGSICRKYNVAYHCDVVQLFGKHPIDMKNVDSISISFHKLHCGTGLGCLVVANSLLKKYKPKGIIAGTQQEGLRGGTENFPGIAACLYGMKAHFKSRDEKNGKICMLRDYLIEQLGKQIKTLFYQAYDEDTSDNCCVIYGYDIKSEEAKRMLCGTILLSFVDKKLRICNTTLRKDLAAKGIIVSTGSACNTKSSKASSLLEHIGATDVLKKGTLRVTLDENNTKDDIQAFVKMVITLYNNTIKEKR